MLHETKQKSQCMDSLKNPEMLIRWCVSECVVKCMWYVSVLTQEAVLSTRDVRWELVAVLTAGNHKGYTRMGLGSHGIPCGWCTWRGPGTKLCSGRSGTPSILLPSPLSTLNPSDDAILSSIPAARKGLEMPLLLFLHHWQTSVTHTWSHVIGQVDETPCGHRCAFPRSARSSVVVLSVSVESWPLGLGEPILLHGGRFGPWTARRRGSAGVVLSGHAMDFGWIVFVY